MRKDKIRIIEAHVPGGYDQHWFKIILEGPPPEEKKELLVKLSGHAYISLHDKFVEHLDNAIIALGYAELLKAKVELGLALADVEGISSEFLQKGQFEVSKLSDGLFAAVERVF